jgi:hypothetical protein
MDGRLGEKRRVTADGATEDEVKAALDRAVAALEPQGRWAFFSQRIKITTSLSGADEVTGSRTVALTSMQPRHEPNPTLKLSHPVVVSRRSSWPGRGTTTWCAWRDSYG